MTEPSITHDPTADLLRAVADQIEAHPETWDQNHFEARSECGTTYCVAGWALRLSHQQIPATGASRDAAPLLGITSDLAETVFLEWWELFDAADDERPEFMPDLLRGLADLPAPRTVEQARHLLAGVNA